MYHHGGILTLYLETSMHAGCGSSPGLLDNPIQREAFTRLPMLQASEVKGALRSLFRDLKHPYELILFGPGTDGGGEYGSALTVLDARLLALPVRSGRGLFAWVTSPFALNRLRQDLGRLPGCPELSAGWPYAVQKARSNAGVAGSRLLVGNHVLLEEFALPAESDALGVGSLARWIAAFLLPNSACAGTREKFVQDLVVVEDEDFAFLSTVATEKQSRVQLDVNKKVQNGPWFDELLPEEALMYTGVFVKAPVCGDNVLADAGWTPEESQAQPDKKAEKLWNILSDSLGNARLQMGGRESLGKGFVALKLQDARGPWEDKTTGEHAPTGANGAAQ